MVFRMTIARPWYDGYILIFLQVEPLWWFYFGSNYVFWMHFIPSARKLWAFAGDNKWIKHHFSVYHIILNQDFIRCDNKIKSLFQDWLFILVYLSIGLVDNPLVIVNFTSFHLSFERKFLWYKFGKFVILVVLWT